MDLNLKKGLEKLSSAGHILNSPPSQGGCLAMPGDSFVFSTERGSKSVEVRKTIKYPLMHRMVLPNKELTYSKC